MSSLFKSQSIPAQIMSLVYSGTIVPLWHEEIIQEYLEVLSRNKFSFDSININHIISYFREYGVKLEKTNLGNFVVRDPKDIVFFEIVLTGRKFLDAKLVTGNWKDFPVVNYVVTPAQMLEYIEKDKKKDD